MRSLFLVLLALVGQASATTQLTVFAEVSGVIQSTSHNACLGESVEITFHPSCTSTHTAVTQRADNTCTSAPTSGTLGSGSCGSGSITYFEVLDSTATSGTFYFASNLCTSGAQFSVTLSTEYCSVAD